MATIDYKEKLKEALNSDNTDYEVVRWIEQNFPELKESGDEKIKKIIKQSLKSYFERKLSIGTNDTDYAECLAWLEKQDKNNMGISEATKKKLEDKLNKALEKETPESWNEFLDEQGEQKPAWSEKYIADVFEKVGLAKIVREQSNDTLTNALQDAMIELSKFIPQPKQKPWSEEDETMITDLSVIVHTYFSEISGIPFKYDLSEDKIRTWLKSVKDKVQPKQKWSEEDENRVNRLIAYFEDKESFTAEDDIVYANWLKSLKERYTWKPSDRQIGALESAISLLQSTTLESLYNELKKLMKE